MSKQVKEMMMNELRSRVGETRDFLIIDIAKVDAITTNKLRLAWREKEISAFTVRNSLARKTFNDLGLECIGEILAGSSTLVWGGEDVVALSKEITKWSKEIGELEIRGGTVEGTALDSAGVNALSKSPSREELISMIAGQILGPGSQLAAALLGPGGVLAGQVKTISEGEESSE